MIILEGEWVATSPPDDSGIGAFAHRKTKAFGRLGEGQRTGGNPPPTKTRRLMPEEKSRTVPVCPSVRVWRRGRICGTGAQILFSRGEVHEGAVIPFRPSNAGEAVDFLQKGSKREPKGEQFSEAALTRNAPYVGRMETMSRCVILSNKRRWSANMIKPPLLLLLLVLYLVVSQLVVQHDVLCEFGNITGGKGGEGTGRRRSSQFRTHRWLRPVDAAVASRSPSLFLVLTWNGTFATSKNGHLTLMTSPLITFNFRSSVVPSIRLRSFLFIRSSHPIATTFFDRCRSTVILPVPGLES